MQVIFLFAFRRPMSLQLYWLSDDLESGVHPLQYELARRKLDTRRPAGMVVTDDLNPIDLRRAETALQWRRQTRQHLR